MVVDRTDDDPLRRQHAALADPHRYLAYQLVAAAQEPVDVAWLAARIDIHHTALRRHLDKLVAAGLLSTRAAPPGRRGRPRHLYRAETPSNPYRHLAALLAEAVRTGRTPRETGRIVGARMLPGDGDAVWAMVAEATRLGFDPMVRGAGCDLQVSLRRCPFVDVAAEDPATVCQLHLGLAEGVAEALGGVEVTGLEMRDPSVAGCILGLRRMTSPPTLPGTSTPPG